MRERADEKRGLHRDPKGGEGTEFEEGGLRRRRREEDKREEKERRGGEETRM